MRKNPMFSTTGLSLNLCICLNLSFLIHHMGEQDPALMRELDITHVKDAASRYCIIVSTLVIKCTQKGRKPLRNSNRKQR